MDGAEYALYITLPDTPTSYGPNAFITIKEETAQGFIGIDNHGLPNVVVHDMRVVGSGLHDSPLLAGPPRRRSSRARQLFTTVTLTLSSRQMSRYTPLRQETEM